jgi:signal transduction histidine kinase
VELPARAGGLRADRRRLVAEREVLIGQLIRSNEDLERFAYAAAHDLKTPLRSIDNLASWIDEDAGDAMPPASREHLRKLRGQVRRMERLLSDVLEYSRIEHRRNPQSAELIDGAALMETVVSLASPPDGFTVRHSGFEALRLPRMPLQQILHNLVSNAVKHHDKPAGTVDVTAENTPSGLIVRVCDDGPGIAPEFHGRIFEMFQTLKPRGDTDGNGMGLTLVKKLVTLHGGDIAVESQPGLGACFRFTWPQAMAEAPPQGQE